MTSGVASAGGTGRDARSARLRSIDALRGAAALAVLGYHLFSPYVLPLSRTAWVRLGVDLPVLLGYTGVHLFLVISGFCIHLRFARQGDPEGTVAFGAFWRRRFRRLYPPYLGALALSALLLIATPGEGGAPFGYPTWRAFAADLGAHAAMLQLFWAATMFGLHNGPLWSLALEEQLYLLYAPFLALRRRVGAVEALGVVLVICLAWRIAGIGNPSGPGVPLMPPLPVPKPWIVTPASMLGLSQAPARWFEWCLGALAVEGYCGLVALPAWCADLRIGALLFAAGAAALFHPAGWVVNDPLFGLAFFVLVNAAVLRERESGPGVDALAWVGLGSYSLYLVHAPVMSFTARMLNRTPHPPAFAPFLVLQAGAALAAALIFYALVERHCIRPRGSGTRR